MGLILQFRVDPHPPGPEHADHRLPAGMDVDVLHGDLLLPLAAVAIQRIEKVAEGCESLLAWLQILAASFEGLVLNHGAPVALHGRGMRGDQLGRHHPLELVLRGDPEETRDGRRYLPIMALFI